MMRPTKIVVLENDFLFSESGQYASTNEVNLTAPGVGMINVHSTMRAYVMDSLFSLAKRASEMKGAEEARRQAFEDEENEDGEGKQEPSASDIYNQVAIGLGVERFPEFLAYAKKVLTNRPQLASVGASRTPITDETWESIEEKCGMEAVEEIIGSFAGFFVMSPTQRSKSGKGKSISSSPATKAASQSSSRKASRSTD